MECKVKISEPTITKNHPEKRVGAEADIIPLLGAMISDSIS